MDLICLFFLYNSKITITNDKFRGCIIMYENHLCYIKKCLNYMTGTFVFQCKLNHLHSNENGYILFQAHLKDAYLSLSKVDSTNIIYRCYLPGVGLRELCSPLPISEKAFFALSWNKNKISLWVGAENIDEKLIETEGSNLIVKSSSLNNITDIINLEIVKSRTFSCYIETSEAKELFSTGIFDYDVLKYRSINDDLFQLSI